MEDRKVVVREKTKKKGSAWPKILLILVIASAVVVSYFEFFADPIKMGYSDVDHQQATEERCKQVAEFMDDYFEQQGLFVVNYGVEWIGYYKYSDQYTVEEYEEMAIGGYYSYTANLSGGEYVTGRVSTYWGDGETPVIVDLAVQSASGETHPVEYSDEKIAQCWKVYYDKAHAA